MDKDHTSQFEVIIIGAGAAGIGAAIPFVKNNLPYVILEARDRVGGRLLAKNLDGVNFDLGASFIHSYGKKNPLSTHIKQLKIPQVVLTKRSRGRVYMDGE